MRALLLSLMLLVPAGRAALPDAAEEALRRGDCTVARMVLDGSEDMLAALALASCGEIGPAEAQLGGGDALEGYGRLLMARQLVEADPARTEALLEGVDLPGEAGLELVLLRARAQIAQGRSLEARPALRALLDTAAGAEARYWLSAGAEDRGDIAAAVATYRTVWSRYVRSPYAERAGERLRALGEVVPDFGTAEGRALARTRADALLAASRAEEALPLYEALGEATGDRSEAWLYTLGYARFKARDSAGALRAWEQLSPLSPGAYGGAALLFDYALATSRAGDYAAAAERYRRLTELYPQSSQADFASFKIGYLDYDAGRLERAIDELKAHLARRPGSEHADEALWFIAWSAYRLDRLDEAEAQFGRLVREHPGSGLSVGARYWRARIAGRRGDAEAERAGLEAVLKGWPGSGYAWFAAERLGRHFTGIGPVEPPALDPGFLAANPDVAAGLRLSEAGLYPWARERLQAGIGPARSGGRSTALALAHALIAAGDYRGAQALARPYCSAPWGEVDPLAISACYPRPEAAVVAAAAARSGLDPLLPYAIMTAESALRPEVTSPAGARGLMQLMPALGEELHRELIGGDYDPDRLYTPGYNAWLGTAELGRLHRRFSDSGTEPALPLVIAGYNGGAEAVARWLAAEEGRGEGDRFTEDIGYTETRRYVRRVLGFLMTYRWIYGEG